MTVLGFASLLLAFSAVYIANLKGSRLRTVVFSLLYVMHAIASTAYYLYTESSGSDAHFYYFDPLQARGQSGLGTIFMVNLVQTLREGMGGSFFDYFMLFQAIGFWGMIFLFKAINEVFEELQFTPRGVHYLTLFLPGLHFWTGAPGKDAPLFLAVALALWSCLALNRRTPALAIAISIMLVVRPHVAVVTLMALAIATLLEPKVRLWVKAGLIAAVLAGAGVMATSLQSTYRVDVSSTESVGEFMAARGSITEESGADMSIVEGSLPLKIFSLWLRPMFIDAEGAMGYVASAENSVLLIIFIFIAARLRTVRSLIKTVLYARFSILFFVVMTLLLALVSFNVGLGLRQKMMAMPCLLVVVATLVGIDARRRAALRGDGRARLHAAGHAPAAPAPPRVNV